CSATSPGPSPTSGGPGSRCTSTPTWWSPSTGRGSRAPTGCAASTTSRASRTPATPPSSPARRASWPTSSPPGRRSASAGCGCDPPRCPTTSTGSSPTWSPSCSAAACTAPPTRRPPPCVACWACRPPSPTATRRPSDMSSRKQVILGAYVAGVNHHTAWWHPDAGSQIDFSTFEHVARTAERGRFDFFFLAEGLALRERAGQVFDQDVVGRPDTLPVLASLAAVTTHLGLAGTINATFNEPYELARQFATLDHLSGGRTAWNVVTSFDAFTGQNFRRGGFLQRSQRYERAAEMIEAARVLWDSWDDEDLIADKAGGRFLGRPDAGRFDITGNQFDIHGRFTVPRSPQGRPVILQAGVSPEGRDFAARHADAIFAPFGKLPEAAEFYRDVKARAARFGRNPDELKILPSASFVLGDTEAEAKERHREIREQQITGQTALI